LTRLKNSDICHISSGLEIYNQKLQSQTGRTLLGIACHSSGVNGVTLKHRIESFSVHVVPVTTGQGLISDFCETVAAILTFLGFKVMISDYPDVTGIAGAFENGADAIMMADDHRFVGINLKTRCVVDNSEATGRVYAAALDLVAKGIKNCDVLVLGCGPVGEAAVRTLLSFGASVTLYDIRLSAAQLLGEKLSDGPDIAVETDIDRALSNHGYIIEATPSADSIPDKGISEHMVVAAPGVPLGVSDKGCQILGDRLIYDTLELGVAAMAISLLL